MKDAAVRSAAPLRFAAPVCHAMCLAVCHARRHWNSPSYRQRRAAPVREAGCNTSSLELYVLPNEGARHNFVTAFAHRRCDGAEGSRTPDLCSAIAALSQLSYSPVRHTRASQSPGLRLHACHYKSPAISRGRDKRLHLNRFREGSQARCTVTLA